MSSVTNMILTRFGFFRRAAILSLAAVFLFTAARAQSINEGFDNITTLPASGWFMKNNSVPIGTTGWFQGNAAVFPAQAGATTSYIGANFNNVSGDNTISNWLLTPPRFIGTGGVLKFWTRT